MDESNEKMDESNEKMDGSIVESKYYSNVMVDQF